jgi:hypothetical protein
MNQIMATVVALAAIAGTTVYEGVRFGFWNDADPEELNQFAKLLADVPESFGDWTSEPAPYDANQLAAAEVREHVSRFYIHRRTGAKLNVFLSCGKTHPMAIHSPDQCYPAAGFTKGETSRQYKHYNGRVAEFWFSRFTRTAGIQEEAQDILWSWAPDDGNWQAPTNPRPHFSNKNALYKLYVFSVPGAHSDNKAAADAFLEEFLPVLDERLFKANQPKETPDAAG